MKVTLDGLIRIAREMRPKDLGDDIYFIVPKNTELLETNELRKQNASLTLN